MSCPQLDLEEPIRRFLGFTEQPSHPTGPTADKSVPDLEPVFNFFPARWRECASKPFAPGLPLEGDPASPSPDGSFPRRSGDPSHILERSKDEVTGLFALVVSHGLLQDEDEVGGEGPRLSDSSR